MALLSLSAKYSASDNFSNHPPGASQVHRPPILCQETSSTLLSIKVSMAQINGFALCRIRLSACFITVTLYLTGQFAMEVYFNSICKTASAALRSPICHHTPTAATATKQHSPFHKGETQTEVLSDGKVYCGYFSLKHLIALLEAERKVKIQFYNYTMTIIAEGGKKKNHSSVS